ncbi:MAG TPA: HDIG domain-containing protein, partial [Acidimicrobiia bacterium]|nr:HDIG domain-containing protein [Acidimicrobiia bacterium]
MSRMRTHPLLVNLLIIAATVVVVAVTLVVGRPEAEPATVLAVGDAAPETYVANGFVSVFDDEATEQARERARNNTQAVYVIDPLARSNVEANIRGLFSDVRAAPTGSGRTVFVEASATSPAPTENPNEFVIEYSIAVRNQSTQSRRYDLAVTPRFSEAVRVDSVTLDQALAQGAGPSRTGIEVDTTRPAWIIVPALEPVSLDGVSGDEYTLSVQFTGDPNLLTVENADCVLEEEATGTGLRVDVNASVEGAALVAQPVCRTLPQLVVPSPDTTEVEDTTTTSTSTTTTTLTPAVSGSAPTTTLPFEEQVRAVEESGNLIYGEAIPTLVDLYDVHLRLVASGEDGFFQQVEQQIVDLAADQLVAPGIRVSELNDRQNFLLQNPPRIIVPVLEPEQLDALQAAAATVLAVSLEPNSFVDQAATQAAANAAAEGVEDQFRTYANGQTVVSVGESIDAVQLEAIQMLGLLEPEPGTSRVAAATLGGLAVLLAALFLWRIAPSRWSQPKHIALLGILLFIAALVARLAEASGIENPELGYAIPAALLGYAAAILYDPRTALLTAVPMAMFTAITTQDPALIIYAAAATVAPVAFVSAVSTRRELRTAVIRAALVMAPVAASVSWLFNGLDSVLLAGVFGAAGTLIGGLLAQGLISFLENLFQVTTTVTLLDLTDRNHPALRLIEEKAPGTFNHSILVGNLAGRAARAIDADPLLAQAAAFYHDLGKTENPQYFIENQFGVSNPHDELAPAESAVIIRRHVTEGLRLARQYRIPPDVAAGIQQHHGTGLMRYFYHRAMEADASVDPNLFRHRGRKPQRKEMAIVMISDAVEGAARALAQQEDPTADSLAKLVDSIVGEKLEDGQLDESDLTFGDLTNVKRALVEALIGYYHTRIPYPGFPGPRV